MAIPFLSKLFSKSPKTEPMQMPMPITYYQPIPQTDRRPDADIIRELTVNEHIPKETLTEHWCYDPKTIALGKRGNFESAILRERYNRYRMTEENNNPRYKWNPTAANELDKLGVSVDDAVHKSLDGYFVGQITNPINVTETRQAIATGQLPTQEKKKGGLLSFIGL
jgi:hypothetical protein